MMLSNNFNLEKEVDKLNLTVSKAKRKFTDKLLAVLSFNSNRIGNINQAVEELEEEKGSLQIENNDIEDALNKVNGQEKV